MKHFRNWLCLGFLLLAGSLAEPVTAASVAAGADAVAVGQRLVANLLDRDYMFYGDEALHYSEAAAAVGALRLVAVTSNEVEFQKIVKRYFPLLDDESKLVSRRAHVDMNVLGIVPLQIALQTGNKRQLAQGLTFADRQWEGPLASGLTAQTRWWIDDLYMVGMLQMQAYRATGESVYAERAARQLAAYLPKLQQSNGLFHHGPAAPVFWGRGNGWVASALAEVLADLPDEDPHRALLEVRYRQMMETLLTYQDESGFWRQILDDPNAWAESSSTAMFAYAMAVGLERKLLSGPAYRPAVERAWFALTRSLDEEGNLPSVCVGTGKSADPAYYLARPRISGDLHGQAPLLWLAALRAAQMADFAGD